MHIILAHGGAGSKQEKHGEAVKKAVLKGVDGLNEGKGALDIAQAVVVAQEDNPIFNAGTGSYMTLDGKYEMDASVMDDAGKAGAVAGISGVKNPVLVARKVMDTPHVLLAGQGAVDFARRHGFPDYNPRSEKAEKRLAEVKEKVLRGQYPDWAKPRWDPYSDQAKNLINEVAGDTVGCVVLDEKGRMAATCSTGGTSIKLPGRVGDSPIIGAGIYAGPSGAVTATGIGEDIIKRVVSWEVYRRMADGMNPQEACDAIVDPLRKDASQEVGIIAVSKKGWGEACTVQMAYHVEEG